MILPRSRRHLPLHTNACEQPTAIVAKTIKGRGVSFMEANNDWHHNRITSKTLDEILAEFDG